MNKESSKLWKKRIEDQRASGLKVNAWCEENNLSKHAYYYWKKQITTMEQKIPEAPPTPVFVELQQAKPQEADSCENLEISWHDLKFSIGSNSSARLAAELISQLRKHC